MISPEDHRKLAVSLFNRTWELIDMPERTVEQNDEMLSAAHASAYHWLQVGSPQNFAISQWQLARVYALLGRPQSAIHHGERSLSISRDGDLGPFYHSYAHEAIARGHLAAGARDKMLEHKAHALAFVPRIDDPEELEFIERDLATLA
jgi:hypothetical protein